MKSYALALIATSAMGVTLRPHQANHSGSDHGSQGNTIGDQNMPNGLEAAGDYDTDGDGRFTKAELQAYADSLEKGDKVNLIFYQEASVTVERAEELLEEPAVYDFDRAFAELRERKPDINDIFANMYVYGDYYGNQDYKCVFKEFFELLNSDPGFEEKFDLEGLENWKGGGDWNNKDILEDPNFIYLAFQYNFIDGYNMNDSSTWIVDETTVERFSGLQWLPQESYEALSDQYAYSVPAEKFSKWLDHVFTESNYVHESGLKPEMREWFEMVDEQSGGNGYLTVQELVDYVQTMNGPEFIDQLKQAIETGELPFRMQDDGIEYGYTLGDILLGAFIGPDRDPGAQFKDRATRLLKTLNIEVNAETDSRVQSIEELEHFLYTGLLYEEE